jgi:hypothetical protein
MAAGAQAQIKISLNYPSTLATENRPKITDQPIVLADSAQFLQVDPPDLGRQRSASQSLTVTVTCLAAGETTIRTTFVVTNVGAGQSLYDTLSLPTGTTTFSVETLVTCG